MRWNSRGHDILAGVRAPHLIRRRELWVPTALGWALLAALLLGGARLGLPGLYSFLAPDRPLGHGVLVVEGWIGEPAFDEALHAWRGGDYAKIVTTGGPIKRGACPVAFRTY